MKAFRRIAIVSVALVIAGAVFYFCFETLMWKVIAWRLGIPQPKYSVVMDDRVEVGDSAAEVFGGYG